MSESDPTNARPDIEAPDTIIPYQDLEEGDHLMIRVEDGSDTIFDDLMMEAEVVDVEDGYQVYVYGTGGIDGCTHYRIDAMPVGNTATLYNVDAESEENEYGSRVEVDKRIGGVDLIAKTAYKSD